MDMQELFEEAADWIANDRDEIILCHTIGGDMATLDPEAREIVDSANDLIERLMDAQAQIAELTRQRDALLEAATAIEFAMKLPGVTGNEVLADSSEIRIGLQAAIESAKGAA